MLSPEGFPVKIYHMLARVQGSQANVLVIGNTMQDLLMKLNLKELSLKMFQPFDVGDWESCFPTSTRSGMMQNGIVSQLNTLVPIMRETESSYLPTVGASEGKDSSRFSILKRLDRGGRVARRLCSKSMVIPSDDPIVSLNPYFAEWMLGFPEGWTDLSR